MKRFKHVVECVPKHKNFLMTQQPKYLDYFNEYKEVAFQTEVDLGFWTNFLSANIKEFQSKNPINTWIHDAGFSMYNINPNGLDTWLHMSPDSITIEIRDLETQRQIFFNWIMNLSIVRLYNASELLILKSIHFKFFSSIKINDNKKGINKIIAEIRNYLLANSLPFDTTNNRYLLEFIKHKSPEFLQFLNLKLNIDWQTKWKDFYELFSILRNIITHNAMIVTNDIKNNINSIAKDVFNYYFTQLDKTKDFTILKPKDQHHFTAFTGYMNTFTANCVKFIAGESDFIFISLYKLTIVEKNIDNVL